ncbi:chaplin [Streptomyces sp. NPDC018031]|uniref:chaplin n=1 Tax=Streptomyces sp. NPDC018031 TaxID=3365033 RepID=UPI0037B12371
MKRLSKAVVLTATAGITVLGAAGGAVAHDGGHGHQGKKPQGKHAKHQKSQKSHKGQKHYAKGGGSGSDAKAVAVGSPGIVSGNVIQVPIDIPINLCNNTISVIGALNGSVGNVCINK